MQKKITKRDKSNYEIKESEADVGMRRMGAGDFEKFNVHDLRQLGISRGIFVSGLKTKKQLIVKLMKGRIWRMKKDEDVSLENVPFDGA